MNFGLSLEISESQKPKIYVATTGISTAELDIIRKITNNTVVIQDALSSTTTYLLTYRCMFTPKYIQALKWKIPILKISYLYDYKNFYRLLNFENCNFSTSNISNDIFKNYFVIQGASYSEKVQRSTDFLVTDSIEDEKIEFCRKYNIPVIKAQSIFRNEYADFAKDYDFMSRGDKQESGIFSKVMFLIDPNLDIRLFNALKRLILNNDGMRLSVENENVDYVISDNIYEYTGKVLYYQFIFDCIKSESFLVPDFYIIQKIRHEPILQDCVCYLSNELKENKKIFANKLIAMGAKVKPRIDDYCNYIIVKTKNEIRKAIKQKIVTFDWVDQCLYLLKSVNDEKYSTKFMLNLLKSRKVSYLDAPKEMVMQFTGLPTQLKTQAIEICKKYGIKYFDVDRYERCTHLIMGKINTSEKFLSSLANGAWILRPDFMENYDHSGNFNFEKYEWKTDESICSEDIKIIESIARWRRYVMDVKKPAFSNWIVKLYCEGKKLESYTRVLENGGAEITQGDDYNHCFVAKNFLGNPELKNFKSTDYIFAYLFKKA